MHARRADGEPGTTSPVSHHGRDKNRDRDRDEDRDRGKDREKERERESARARERKGDRERGGGKRNRVRPEQIFRGEKGQKQRLEEGGTRAAGADMSLVARTQGPSGRNHEENQAAGNGIGTEG